MRASSSAVMMGISGGAVVFLNMMVVNGLSSSLSSSFIASSRLPTFAIPKSPTMLSVGSVGGVGSVSTVSTSSTSTLSMLVEPCGKDALTSLTKSASGTSPKSIIRKTPASIRNVISTASIPVGAVAGFVLTPSRRIIANAVGAGITGIVSSVGKSKLDAMSAEVAKPAIAQLLLDAIETSNNNDISDSVDKLRGEVQTLARNFKVDVENGDLNGILMDIYTKYILAMCKNPYAKTTELKELSNLRAIFNLSSLDVGEAHFNAATEFFRTTCLFTPEEDLQDEDHPDRMSLDKLLWLSSRAIVSSEESSEAAGAEGAAGGDGAYVFEMSRIAKALKVDFPEDVTDRILHVAAPFYERALTSTRAKLDTQQVSPAMLERARHTLGIDTFVKRDMHVNCYTQELRSLLGLNNESTEAATDADADADADMDAIQAMNNHNLDQLIFPDGALDRLKQLQTVLEIEDEDAEYELANQITPLFQKTVIDIFDQSTDPSTTTDPNTLWQQITTRQSQLCLSTKAMMPLLESAVVQKLGTPLDTAMNFARVSNEIGAHESLLEALRIKESVFQVLEQFPDILTTTTTSTSTSTSTTTTNNDDANDENQKNTKSISSLDEKFFSPAGATSACGFLSPEDRQKLYTLFLSRTIKNSVQSNTNNNNSTTTGAGMTVEVQQQLQQIATLLAMSEYDVSNAARGVCGPLVEKELKAAALEVTGDDWTPVLVQNLKKRIDQLVERMSVPDTLVKEYAMNVYKDSLRIVALKCPNGIPNQDMYKQLSLLQSLLNLTSEDVSNMHLAAFGTIYKKSVLESMGTTGVIRPEFREPLQTLIKRLGIDAKDAKTLYFSAVEEKMTPMVQLLANELERSMLTQQQLAQKRGKDMGQDVFQGGAGPTGKLGIGTDGNTMGGIMNLIDFYKENDILEKIQTGSKKVEKKVGNETRTEDQPIYQYSYPITALGMSAIEAEMAEMLYRQFVVGGFTAEAAQQARYEAETETFGGILGLTKERQDSVGGDIGVMVYENYIKNALKSKDSLDQQDMMFLAQIQQKLNLSSEQGAELMQNAQKKVLFDEANAVFDNPTAATIKVLREKCNAMGLEMYDDVGLPKDRLETMFAVEIMSGIDADEILPESGELLTEIQESLGLSVEDCERILAGIVERKTVDAIYKIEKEILRGREENCVPEIKEMLKYAAFVGGEVEGIELNEETANKIVNIYDSVDISDADIEVVTKNKELLRVAVGLA